MAMLMLQGPGLGELAMNDADLTPAEGKRPWYQFSLKSLLIATAIAGTLTSYVVNNGLRVAALFGLLCSIMWVWVVRARKRWSALSSCGRIFAVAEGSLFLALLVGFVLSVQFNPSFARERIARRVQENLISDARFADVRVLYLENQVDFLRVEGHVDSESAFQSLREKVERHDWNEVYWNVIVDASGRSYDGWSSMLFGDKRELPA
jgi:ABC-type multidrug transport system fused ATPase/permease subunit